MKKLAILITHPIQYYVPLFKHLSKNCNLKVFYTWGEKGAQAKYDPGFAKTILWDLPLLDGYAYEFLTNTAKDPGSHHYRGIINPDLIVKLNSFHPDAILIYGWAYQSHLSAMRHFKGKTQIWFRGDSTLMNDKLGFKKVLRKLFLKWVYLHVNKAFYVGRANKAYFNEFGLKKNQLIFAPHAIDNVRFAKDMTKEANELRASLQIKGNEFLILFAGKLEPQKNPMLLLQAFIELNLPGVHLLFVGNGILEKSLKSEVENKGSTMLSMKSQVHFMDFQNQSQIPVVYQACDLLCLPSKRETWGLVTNEAMASGKAVLISDRVGCSEDLVKNEQNGYIFANDEISDLKDKLVLLLANKSQLKKMGEKSYAIIKNWSIEIQSAAILKELNL